MIRFLAAVVIASGACGADAEAPRVDADRDSLSLAAGADSIVVRLPPATRRHMSLVGVGSHNFVGVFPAQARYCDAAHLVEVSVLADSIDVILLFRLSEDGVSPEGAYQVSLLGYDLLNPGTVRIGFAIRRGRVGQGFRGTQGAVTLTSYGAIVSGDFDITIQETSVESVTEVEGVFDRLRVGKFPPVECREATDALRAEADSAANEG